jgi:glycerol-3-phosphate dehydrogenase (NAD(P)+)
MKVTVIGAGAWGTALAQLLAQGGQSVTLWGYNAEHLTEIRRRRRNDRHLPEIELDDGLVFEVELADAVRGAEAVVLAIPSKVFREVAGRISDYPGLAVSVTKGIEYETGLTMCGVLREAMPRARPVALSGPTLALEVARGIPSAIVAASEDGAAAQAVQELFHRPRFRVYTSTDRLGVELGGALKNVIAIAAGVCDGLGFGDNSKAALITRAIAEIRRLGVACGAQFDTFAGLSGLGDLTVTCFSKLSRNRTFGERLGRGEKVEQVLESAVSVAEGYPTARSAHRLVQSHGITTPIIEEVHAMLYEGKDIAQAVQDLTARESKPED